MEINNIICSQACDNIISYPERINSTCTQHYNNVIHCEPKIVRCSHILEMPKCSLRYAA